MQRSGCLWLALCKNHSPAVVNLARRSGEGFLFAANDANDANAAAGSWLSAYLRLRRLIHGFAVPWDCVPRVAAGTDCSSKQAWNASSSLASIRRLGLAPKHPSMGLQNGPRDSRAQSKPYAREQAGLHGASLLAEWRPAQLALAGACLTGRRVSVAYGDATTGTRPCPRRQPFAAFALFAARNSFSSPWVSARGCDVAFVLVVAKDSFSSPLLPRLRLASSDAEAIQGLS